MLPAVANDSVSIVFLSVVHPKGEAIRKVWSNTYINLSIDCEFVTTNFNFLRTSQF